jgi:integrase
MSKRANGQGSVRKIAGAWYIRLTKPANEPGKPGKRTQIRTDARTRSEALDKLRNKLTEMSEGRFDPDAAHTRVPDLYADLKRDYEINGKRVGDLDWRWKHLQSAFGGDLATAVTTPRIRLYVENRLAEGASRGTVQLELAALRRMFRLGAQADKILRVPHFPTIRLDNARKGFFEREQFEKVRAELPDYLQPLVTVAYWTGWRKSELLNLERRQTDLKAGTLRLDIGTTKNKQGRTVYLPPEALAALKAWDEKTAALERERGLIVRHVFHNEGQAIRNFYHAWRSACNRAGLAGRMLHDFRRTAARNYVRAGVHERVAMELLGHKTRAIFDRYNIASEQDLREAAEKIASAPVGQALGKTAEVFPLTDRRELR